MRRLLSKKGQSTLEYAILIAVVVSAVIGMQTYVKRGIQGRVRDAADDVGAQFEPTTTNVTQTMNRFGHQATYILSGGSETRDESGRGTQWTTDTTVTP